MTVYYIQGETYDVTFKKKKNNHGVLSVQTKIFFHGIIPNDFICIQTGSLETIYIRIKRPTT